MSVLPLESYLSEEAERVRIALEDALPDPNGEGGSEVIAAARYAVEAGGKRLRPILCVAAYRAFRPMAPAAIYRLAASIELIHTYSLVHDDLPSMDNDEVRRGRPATHMAHGVATATAAGAALIPAAARLVSAAGADLGLSDDARAALVRTLCRAAGGGGMVGGQLLDLRAEGRPIPLDEMERIHRLKTGALLTAAPVLGGMAAGAGAVARDALMVYGSAVGLAFQVVDDILDVTGTATRLGKSAGRDTELEKATYPALAGLDGARELALREVDTALAALDAAGIESEELRMLGRYAVERDR